MTAIAEPKRKPGRPRKVVDPAPAPKPPALPGEHGFDWQTEYAGEEVFVFTSSEGVTVGLAALNDVRRPKPGVLRRLRHENDLEQMWYIIEQVSSPLSLEVQERLGDEDYGKMFADWSEWSRTSAGE